MAPKQKVTKNSTKAAVNKATKAAKSVKKTDITKTKKIRTSTRFRRGKTQDRPKTARPVGCPKLDKFDNHTIIKCPLTTESAMKKIEEINTLVFLCDSRANKKQIKVAVSKLYDFKVAKVNTLIRPDGVKKAYVHLPADFDALDIANKIGII
eukprot:GHVR01170601.1.p1 GENE.GHVR01170601.1~~GHVR01170601.1.p1  ORF type:complete len:152 (+),score=24.47 GHVR01170601.1:212-667(+)